MSPQQQHSFKAEDAIRCVNAIGSSFLREGQTYHVKRVLGAYLWLEGSHAPWPADRFAATQ